jgi:hypothetical protein
MRTEVMLVAFVLVLVFGALFTAPLTLKLYDRSATTIAVVILADVVF